MKKLLQSRKKPCELCIPSLFLQRGVLPMVLFYKKKKKKKKTKNIQKVRGKCLSINITEKYQQVSLVNVNPKESQC